MHRLDTPPMHVGLFDQVRSLRLDPVRYAIGGSGPLGIRKWREINDIDLVVDDTLFAELAELHPHDGGRLVIAPAIEAFGESAFPDAPGVPSVREQIRGAETIEGLRFVTLEVVLAIKANQGREKDLADIELIRARLG